MSKSGYVRLPARQHNPAHGHQFSLPTFSSRPAPPPKLDLVKQLVKRAIPLLLFSVVCIYFAIGKSGFVWDLTTPATVGTPRSPKHNQGWVTFDSRRHSPFLNRLHNTAPATQQERLFSEPCRDLWISRNELCPEIRKRQLKHAHRFDVVHTWQNGSDPHQSMARASALNTTNHLGESGNVERHWRIHDELRHSLRSVFKTYGKYASAIDNFFVLSADLPYDSDRRIGMVPTWLDIHHPFHHRSQIRPVFPWQIHRTSAFPSQEAAEQWRQESLPVFNSMAVESQFANIPSENDIWLMSCDDFFLLNDQTPSDVYTPLFGPILRLRFSNLAQVPGVPWEEETDKDFEWVSLRYMGWLIGNRFGMRPKYLYIEHVHKTYSKSLLREVESMFAEEIRDGGAVAFRGRGNDVNMHSLFIHFVIERHREALLWSAIVLKTDQDHDGTIDEAEFTALLSSIGASSANESLDVQQAERNIQAKDLLAEAGLPAPLESWYVALSANGYALDRADGHELGKSPWIKYDHPGPKSEPFCVLNIQECFPSSSRQERGWDSSSIFKQITFKQPECGDCLIMALLSLSGTKGLEGFLPPAEDSLNFKDRHANPDGLDSPILPLTKKWEDADFSFNVNVPHGMSPRSLATRLLLRYQYTMGRERHKLAMLFDAKAATEKLGAIPPPTWGSDDHKHNPSFIAVNDDIVRDEQEVNTILANWMHSHWPKPLDWELDG